MQQADCLDSVCATFTVSSPCICSVEGARSTFHLLCPHRPEADERAAQEQPHRLAGVRGQGQSTMRLACNAASVTFGPAFRPHTVPLHPPFPRHIPLA